MRSPLQTSSIVTDRRSTEFTLVSVSEFMKDGSDGQVHWARENRHSIYLSLSRKAKLVTVRNGLRDSNITNILKLIEAVRRYGKE